MTGILGDVPDTAPERRGAARAVLAALLLGVAVGGSWHALAPASARTAAAELSVVSDLFLRLVRMIVAPLVFATVAAALARPGPGGGGGAAGRLLVRAAGWFVAASLVSLGIGMGLADLLQPGRPLRLVLPAAGAAGPPPGMPALGNAVLQAVPDSVVQAMARNDILQILVFAVLFGAAAGQLPAARRERVAALLEDLVQVMLRLTGAVMRLAPAGAFAAVAALLARRGLGTLPSYGRLLGGYYAGLALLWVVLAGAGMAVLGRRRGAALLSALRGPMLVAFSTASSEAAYPRTVERLLGLGISERVVGFVLPLGYAVNLDGAMMFQAFAVLFVAQAYGIVLSPGRQLELLLVCMLLGKGIAGVPRAALLVVAAVSPWFGLPDAGVALLLGVDPLMDMGRSATNVLGNGLAAAAVARWEGEAADGAG